MPPACYVNIIIMYLELNKDAVCHQFYLTCCQYFATGALEGFGGFETGQVIHIMKYTDDLLKMARK